MPSSDPAAWIDGALYPDTSPPAPRELRAGDLLLPRAGGAGPRSGASRLPAGAVRGPRGGSPGAFKSGVGQGKAGRTLASIHKRILQLSPTTRWAAE